MTPEATTETRNPQIAGRANAHAPRPYQPNTDPFRYLTQHFAQRTPEYHRSKLYNAGSVRKPQYRQSRKTHATANNPLIAAAGPIFSLLNRLDQPAQATPNTAKLNAQHWQHEMRAFIDQATHAGYNQKTIAAASFALSKMVDDALSQPHHAHSHSKTLLPAHLMASQQKNTIFNDLLHACEQDPSDHLDLTELLFLCVANSRHMAPDEKDMDPNNTTAPHHALTRTDAIEKSMQLYASIKQHRRLSSLTTTSTDATSFKRAQAQYRKRWFTVGFILLTLLGEYGLYHHNRTQFIHQQASQHQTNQEILSLL